MICNQTAIRCRGSVMLEDHTHLSAKGTSSNNSGSSFCKKSTYASDLCVPNSNSCIFTPIENSTHVYMNLFTRNSPYYHLLNYLLFLLKHPVYIYLMRIRNMFRSLVRPSAEAMPATVHFVTTWQGVYQLWTAKQQHKHNQFYVL